MKILSIDIKAFGPFTGKCLDFSSGSEGLQVVYGPNEAGKSAALRALRALLFGIIERTPDNFLHDSQKLRIAGTLRHSDGTVLSFQRRKGRSKTLLAGDNTTLNDAVLQKFLGNVGEELFCRMFGISHQDLVRGGREIVSGHGGVGESLFTAGLGASGLHDLLTGLDTEAEGLFRPRASGRFINAKISEYNQARKECQEASLPARSWEQHEQSLRETEQKQEGLKEQLKGLRMELQRFKRIMEVLPIVGERKDLLAERHKLGEVMILPQDFIEERRAAARERERARLAETAIAERMQDVERKLTVIEIPEGILRQETVITELHKRLGSHVKAMTDYIRLKGERDQLLADAENILRDLRQGLTLEQAESFRLGTIKRQHIGELTARYHTLIERQNRASRQVSSLDSKIQLNEGRLRELGEPPDIADIRQTVRRVQSQGDLESQLSGTMSEIKFFEKKAETELKKFPLWTKTLGELEALAVPMVETVDRFEGDLSEMQKALDKISSRIGDTACQISEIDREIEAAQRAGAVPTESDLERARTRRQDGWNLVRASWLEGGADRGQVETFACSLPLADAYENSVKEADELADRLRREADRVAKVANWIASRKKLAEEVDEHEVRKKVLVRDVEKVRSEWLTLWQHLDMAPFSPKEMRSWLQRQSSLVQMSETIRGQREKASQLEKRIKESKGALVHALQNCSLKEPRGGLTLQELLAKSQALLDATDKTEQQRSALVKTLEEIRIQRAEALRDDQSAAGEIEEWRVSWEKVLSELGLEATESPSAVNSFIETCTELFKKVDAASGLQKRMNGIVKEADQFSEDICSLSGLVAPDLVCMPPEQAAAELHGRLTKAKEDAAARKELRQQYEKEEKTLKEEREIRNQKELHVEALRIRANCRSDEALERLEEISIKAAKFDDLIRQLDKQLLSLSGGMTVNELIAETEAVDRDALPVLVDELEEKIKDNERRISEIDRIIGSVRNELERMDGNARAAEAAQRAQAALAQIRTGVEQYVRLRLAAAVLRSEIERYRSMNQGPILERASELFFHMTLGSFARLRTDFDERDVPVLVGVRPDGEVVHVEGMSDGTCDQLYLALRLASLERHLAHNEPMPFIIDDILINFDDERAAASLKVLAELSHRTQVIFFTHHRHLLELAAHTFSPDALYVHSL